MPSTGVWVGPGHSVTIQTDLTMTLGSGYINVDAVNTTHSGYVARSQLTPDSDHGDIHTQTLTLGWNHRNNHFEMGPQGGAPGDDLTFQIQIPGLESLQFFSGFFWDPFGGFGVLIDRAIDAGRLGGGGGGGLVGLDPYDDTVTQLLGNTQGGVFHNPLIGVTTVVPYSGIINGGTVYDLSLPGAGVLAGLTWEAINTPSYVGGSLGVITEGNRRVIQVVVFHNLFGGIPFADQTFDSHQVTGTCWFDSYSPSAVSVYAYPGYQLNLSWLLLP